MEKMQKLELMDKIQRELEDLQNSQTALLKKVSQIEAHNMTLGDSLLDEKLPDLQEQVDNGVGVVGQLVTEFAEHRNKFYEDNHLATLQDPTAK